MQPYQEEYISNLKDIHILTARKRLAGCSFATYQEALAQDRQQVKEKIERNMYLLREELFPLLDNLLDANAEQLEELYSFANELLSGRNELDGGLFCQIHKALLSRARLSKDRNTIIRELYWLGMGLHNMCGKMVGLDYAKSEKYMSQMRLCFAEAAAYLKYFDEIDDNETRGYIFRSRANTSLGQFKSASEKIRRVRQTLQILQDEGYQEKAPELPWERYIYMTHQQMSSSISYSRENDMTSQDVADIMESAHIVYERQIADAKERNATLPVKSAFSCFATEYYCGLSVLEELLANMETLMDAADSTDFSSESMYGIISLPAFYSQYLREYPEYLAGREEYLEGLYQRVLDYVDRQDLEEVAARHLCCLFCHGAGISGGGKIGHQHLAVCRRFRLIAGTAAGIVVQHRGNLPSFDIRFGIKAAVFRHTVQNTVGPGPADRRLRPAGNGGDVGDIRGRGTLRPACIAPEDGNCLFPCGGVIHAEGSAAIAGDDAGFCCPGYRVTVPGSGGHVRKGRGVGHGWCTAHAVQHRGQHGAGQGCLRGESGVRSAGQQTLFPAVLNGPGVPRIGGNVGKAGSLAG